MTTLVPMKYLIDWSIVSTGEGSMQVEGFAFETPGWPEFHACVRRVMFGRCSELSEWVVDHFESGLRVRQVIGLRNRDEAPMALKKVLDRIGKKRVREVIGRYEAGDA